MPRRRSLAVLRHRNHRGAARQGPLHHHRPHRHRADGRGRRAALRAHAAGGELAAGGRRGRGRRGGRRKPAARVHAADPPLGRARLPDRLLDAAHLRLPHPRARPAREGVARRAGLLFLRHRRGAPLGGATDNPPLHRVRPLLRRAVRGGDGGTCGDQPARLLHGSRLCDEQPDCGWPLLPRGGDGPVWPDLPPLLHLHGHHDGPGRAVAQPLRLHPPLWRPFALDHRRLPPGRPAGRSARRVLQPLLDGLSHSGRRHARPRTDGRAALLVGPRLCSLHRRARRVQPSRRPAPLQGCHRDRQRVQHRVRPGGGQRGGLPNPQLGQHQRPGLRPPEAASSALHHRQRQLGRRGD
mmetsp:Transcript_36895/g.119073  ORF Transcript_36895/g.119073 Transcript_36895/m.119073 type:complete len:353 (+) Transcript_36895:704-1762(+)